jgi:hypothetical protein
MENVRDYDRDGKNTKVGKKRENSEGGGEIAPA